MTSPTFGVSPSELPVLIWIDLPIMLRGNLVKTKEELFASTMTRFIVIDVPSSCNAIFERQPEGNLHLRIDVKYLTVIFEAKEGDAKIFIAQAKVKKVFVKA